MQDSEKPTWVFELNVFGPIQIPARFALDEVESFYFDDVFFRSIEVKGATQGAQCSIKAHAESGAVAGQVALHTLDQVAHILALQTNLALVVSRQESRPFARNNSSHKRIMDKMEWQQAFREAHHLLHREPSYLQALGQYRKALGEENPINKYITLFQAMESVARHGSAIQLSGRVDIQTTLEQSFAQLWKDKQQWPHLQREQGLLEDLIDLYVKAVGGVVPIVPSIITRIADRLEVLHRLTHAFLVDWRNQNVKLPGVYIHSNLHIDTGWGDVLQ